jgi:hypothetical protein
VAVVPDRASPCNRVARIANDPISTMPIAFGAQWEAPARFAFAQEVQMTQMPVSPQQFEDGLDIDAEAHELPGWPKVVGIISIVWGGIGITCIGCGVAGALFAPSLIPRDQAAQMPPPMMSPLQYLQMLLGVVMAILLIFAGVLTLRRNISGRYLHLAYAALSLPLFALSIWAGLQQQAAMDQWAAQNPDSPMAKSMSGPQAQIGQVVGWAFGAAFGLLYPLFLFIWFGLIKRTPRSMGAGMVEPREVI